MKKIYKASLIFGILLAVSLTSLVFAFKPIIYKQYPDFDRFKDRDPACEKVRISQIQREGNEIKISSSAIIMNVTNTYSMIPSVFSESKVLVTDAKDKEICVGDIVVYNGTSCSSEYENIAHRVISIKSDRKGAYYELQGDNNWNKDSCKVRRENIKYIGIAVIY